MSQTDGVAFDYSRPELGYSQLIGGDFPSRDGKIQQCVGFANGRIWMYFQVVNYDRYMAPDIYTSAFAWEDKRMLVHVNAKAAAEFFPDISFSRVRYRCGLAAMHRHLILIDEESIYWINRLRGPDEKVMFDQHCTAWARFVEEMRCQRKISEAAAKAVARKIARDKRMAHRVRPSRERDDKIIQLAIGQVSRREIGQMFGISSVRVGEILSLWRNHKGRFKIPVHSRVIDMGGPRGEWQHWDAKMQADEFLFGQVQS